jgi:hypothetical protein
LTGEQIKKSIIIILFLLIPVSVYGWNASMMVGGSSGECALTFTDILFFYRFENTDTEDYPGNGMTRNDGAVFSGTSQVGSYSLSCPNANDYTNGTVTSEDIFPATKGRLGMWYRWSTAWAEWKVLFRACDAGCANEIVVDHNNSSGSIQFNYDGSTVNTNGTAIPTVDTWYFVEVAWDTDLGDGSDYMEIFVNGVSKGSSSAKTLTPPSVIDLNFGNDNAAASSATFVDNAMVSNDKTRDFWVDEDCNGVDLADTNTSPR